MQDKKPCPWYAVVHGTAKRCWIGAGEKCPDGVRCEPGVKPDVFVLYQRPENILEDSVR